MKKIMSLYEFEEHITQNPPQAVWLRRDDQIERNDGYTFNYEFCSPAITFFEYGSSVNLRNGTGFFRINMIREVSVEVNKETGAEKFIFYARNTPHSILTQAHSTLPA